MRTTAEKTAREAAPATLPRLGKTLPRSSSDVRSTAFLLYYAPRGDSFPDVYSAIIAYSGKSLPAFFAAPEIYFPLILLTQVNIRDKGVKYSGLAAKDTQAFAPIGIKDSGNQYIGFRPTANNALTVKGYFDGSDNLYPSTGNQTATLADGSGCFSM